jgi:zinc D-Ala-D-Ala carboxypeptidase
MMQMETRPNRRLRCAIYTRKSSEEGLDMEFNSLDAQREACEAYIASQKSEGFLGFGFYPRSGFIHVDLGPARQWGERFPVRATAFAEETPPARDVLADSRTMKGGGAAGVATLGAAGVEVAQSVLAETQSAILPLVPYLDTLRWVFIVVALGGIAVTIYARLDDWRRGRR